MKQLKDRKVTIYQPVQVKSGTSTLGKTKWKEAYKAWAHFRNSKVDIEYGALTTELYEAVFTVNNSREFDITVNWYVLWHDEWHKVIAADAFEEHANRDLKLFTKKVSKPLLYDPDVDILL